LEPTRCWFRDLDEFLNVAFQETMGESFSLPVGGSTDTHQLLRALTKAELFDQCEKCREIDRINAILDAEQRSHAWSSPGCRPLSGGDKGPDCALLEVGDSKDGRFVHDLQVVDSVPRDPTDQPLSVIATPTHAIRIKRLLGAPTGIDWTRLSAEDLEEMPILAELKRMTTSNA
jgi:hypothetical protein